MLQQTLARPGPRPILHSTKQQHES
uniref:Uncharacterized protein n=1 Tax=Arundo donax TaxID=35708 RepID=A0A0A9AXV4_ARUDO